MLVFEDHFFFWHLIIFLNVLLLSLIIQVYTGVWLRHYMPLNERMVSTEADKLGRVSISNASRRRLAGSGI
jgi:hypothetical protein